jgi:hypothetical protein
MRSDNPLRVLNYLDSATYQIPAHTATNNHRTGIARTGHKDGQN